MTLRDDLVARLEHENDDLRERVRVLEEITGVSFEVPPVFCLTRNEAVIFGALLKNKMVTRSHLMTLIYGLHPQDEAEIKIIDVWVHKMRRKVKAYKIDIATIWGQGYTMPAESKAIVSGMLAELAA